MYTLYPPIHCYQYDQLAVSDEHSLYYEQSGNPLGLPVLFVHGGPGGGCSAEHRRFFDPDYYRIIAFDQRGCGRSTPYASVTANSTQHLLADMECLREHLGIEQWVVFGGSWGATLSLVYAQTYPQRVMGLILRGVFLGRYQDIGWLYQAGASRVFPDYWHDFQRVIPEAERGDMVMAYYRRLTGDDEVARMAAAKAWSIWEGRCSTLLAKEQVVEHYANPHTAMSLATIEAHYFVNQCFLQPNQILNNAESLAEIPGIIVHGRYDMVCPLDQAVSLYEAWPQAELDIIRDAGHSAFEASIVHGLVRATKRLHKQLVS